MIDDRPKQNQNPQESISTSISPNLEAEQALIGCMLLEPERTVPEIMSKLTAGDFQNEITRTCFNKIFYLFRSNQPIDTITVISNLPSEYKPVIVKIVEALPTTTNFKKYIQLVIQTRKRIKAYESLTELQAKLLEGGSIEECQESAIKISESLSADKADECVSAQDGILNFYKQYQEGKRKQYITTGIAKIDKYTFMNKGDFVIIGARPSAGKTAITLQMALHMAKTHKVAYFSLETSAEKLYDRAISNFAHVSFSNIKNGLVGESASKDWEKIATASSAFSKLNLFIVPASGYTVAKIESKAVELGAEIIFVDYLSLVKARGKDRFEQVTNVSMGLHNLAQQRKIMVVALSQLSRAGVNEPSMSDLRESGQCENDADIIMLLHNTAPNEESADRILTIAKNKEGQVGQIRLAFEGDYQKFYERENYDYAD